MTITTNTPNKTKAQNTTPYDQIQYQVSDFDQECLDLASRLTRWRNAALRGLRASIDGMYDQHPVDDQTDFERGREHAKNQVMTAIDGIISDR